jgi:hypothetical protein
MTEPINCFAYYISNGEPECRALNEMPCLEGKRCAFKATPEEAKKSRQKAMDRLCKIGGENE